MKRRKNEIREELENLSPFLSKMKEEKEGFEIPRNYFKSLPNRVFEKLGNEPSPLAISEKSSLGFWSNPFQFILKPRYALAFATLSLLVTAGIFWTNNSTETAPLADLTSEEIQTYISNNIYEFDEALFLESDLGFENFESLENAESDEFLNNIIDDLDIEDLEELL